MINVIAIFILILVSGILLAFEKNKKIDLEIELEETCNSLCGVLDQSYAGFSEDDTGIYRTQYNYDAAAVDLLEKHGYVEILEGEWPQTKHLTFKFTDKRVK